MKWSVLPVWFLFASLIPAARAAPVEYHVPQARLPFLKTAPVLDGEIHEEEWAGAARMERLGYGPTLSPQEASFWVGCDGREVFIAMVSETPPNGKLLSRVNPQSENGDARTWMDDSVELVLDPLRSDPTDRRRLYHANLNAKGAINDTAYKPSGGGEAWRGHWRTTSKIIGNRWHFEAALPLKDMNVQEADLQQPFGIRVVRNWKQYAVGVEQAEWSPRGGAFLNPETIPVVAWDARAPVVQTLQLHAPDKPALHIKVAVRNPRTEAMEVQALLKCIPKNSAPITEIKPLSIPPGGIATIELAGNVAANEELYTLIQVTSPDGKTIYYLRDFSWKLERPDPLWIVDENAAKKLDVSFAYFPYHDIIRAKVGIQGLEEKAKVKNINLFIRAKGASRVVASTRMPPIRQDSTQMEWKVTPLLEGRYELVVELEGVTISPVIQDFVRHQFPWEHNSLGRSDTLVAPFDPIQVDGQKVRTILRTHTLSKLGLWDQVESQGKPLLKKPMRLEIRSHGQTMEPKVREFKFVDTKPTSVISESVWSAGVLEGTARSEWDYDGMMQWTLNIQPSQEVVESMTLVIPLDNPRMPLFHACTDGIRFNYAGAAPSGQGRIWDGSQAARNSLAGTYVPYIWLGAEERGFCVFGENDRGWVRDPKVPCQELVRNGDTLELRLNLIAPSLEGDALSSPGSANRVGADGATPRLPSSLPLAPSERTVSRRIVIGFQATPTKPMPEGWRTWTMNSWEKHPLAQQQFQFMGSCWQWGTLTPCSDIYPRDEDFRIYEKFAESRKTGNIDKDFVEQWLAGYKVKDEDGLKGIRGNVEYGFRVVAGKPQNVLLYTNARGVRFDTPEGQTFLDEWYREAYATRKWGPGGGVAYDLDPVESFRDYAMWYYKKMIETFADNIYWDDTYLQSNFDPVGTDAYEMMDGVIQPSVGLFNMRDLIRRTAVLCHELGKPPRNMSHITNAAIAPILSFGQTHLTWEDRSGAADFQDRFTRDYLRAESIGLQYGSVPFALLLVSGPDKEKNTWAFRTAAGVLLTHEIKPLAHYADYWKNLVRLLEFGYGGKEVRVSRYWEENHPVRIEGAEAATLVASKPGAAIIVVCDYSTGPGAERVLDISKLGLSGKIGAKDMENDQMLPLSADGKIRFMLKKHDFKVILIQKET